MQKALQEFWDNLSQEMMGLLLVVVGVYLLFSLMAGGTEAQLAYWTGWTGWLTALGILTLGGVLILGQRAGYWNPEALIGGELLLLGLQAATYVQATPQADWLPPVGYTESGLLGWGLGNLLLSGLGRWPAALALFLLLLYASYLLLRHTPLVYVMPYVLYLEQTARHLLGRMDREAGGATILPAPPPLPISTPLPSPPAGPPPDLAADPPANPRPARSPAPSPAPAEAAKKRTPPKAKRDAAALQTVRPAEQLPPLTLLESDSGRYGSMDTARTQQLIEQTLADFNIPVRVVNVESGPTVTQYGLEPLYIERAGQRRKVRVSRIVNLADDLALALAAPSVRIEAPVPGHPYVGIEVPNVDKTLVTLRGLLESAELGKYGGALPLVLGRNTAGNPVITDLTRAPHLLIAGATGSGKSVCLNTIITSLLMHHGPESLRFIMVDPKMVELPGYNGIPHLIGKVITEMDQVVGALTWLLLQMDDRYQRFREAKVRNITAYNDLARKKKSDLEPLPYLALVVDELADLMMTAPEEIERHLVRLAQMARATGIHLILATQRPSTDVVTGLIKANFPTRVAFAVTSSIDSRVVLDGVGAEKLLGQGDMLFMRPDAAKLQRVQGCFVSDVEIERVVKFWRDWDRQQNPDGPVVRVAPWIGLLDQLEDEESLLHDAVDAIRGMETCSASQLQRKLRIGYPRAARLMEEMEAKGIVGPDQGGGQGRRVLLKDEEEEDGEDEEDMDWR